LTVITSVLNRGTATSNDPRVRFATQSNLKVRCKLRGVLYVAPKQQQEGQENE
jgi:hypothetical protein